MYISVAVFFLRRGSLRGRTEILCKAVQMEENMSKKALLIGILVIVIGMLFLTWAALTVFGPRM